jgi:hypothetical protein
MAAATQMVNTIGTWSETALITISRWSSSAGTTINENLHGVTETIDIDLGEKGVDQIPTLGGGRLMKKTPQDLTNITLEMYTLGIGGENAVSAVTAPTTANGIEAFFADATLDTTEPLSALMTRNRTPYRLSFLWTDDTAATTGAINVTAASTNSKRLSFAFFFLTSCKITYTDGVYKVTAIFTGPAFNRNGVANIKFESANATALPIMTDFCITNYTLNATADYTW